MFQDRRYARGAGFGLACFFALAFYGAIWYSATHHNKLPVASVATAQHSAATDRGHL